MKKDKGYDRKWIKPGLEVAHKDHPERKYYVDHIKKKVIEIPTGQAKEDGRPIYEKRSRIIGVQCRYFEDGKWKFLRFHTREIVPWAVAEKGISAIIAFMESVE